MIPHDTHSRPRRIVDAASYLSVILKALGACRLFQFNPRPVLGIYSHCEQIPPRIRPRPFDVARVERGGKRISPERVRSLYESYRLRQSRSLFKVF